VWQHIWNLEFMLFCLKCKVLNWAVAVTKKELFACTYYCKFLLIIFVRNLFFVFSHFWHIKCFACNVFAPRNDGLRFHCIKNTATDKWHSVRTPISMTCAHATMKTWNLI
jgi:hypothetical protein